jgi:hypothetical protein
MESGADAAAETGGEGARKGRAMVGRELVGWRRRREREREGDGRRVENGE